MKTINVTIPAQVHIGDPEHYNGHSHKVIATIRTADGRTNIRHETLIIANGDDPTEMFLKVFGATLSQAQPSPVATDPVKAADSGKYTFSAPDVPQAPAKKKPAKKKGSKKSTPKSTNKADSPAAADGSATSESANA